MVEIQHGWVCVWCGRLVDFAQVVRTALRDADVHHAIGEICGSKSPWNSGPIRLSVCDSWARAGRDRPPPPPPMNRLRRE